MNKPSAKVSGAAGVSRQLKEFYERMFDTLGPQSWWPAETRFEMVTGAILTQNTNWGNVERAIAALKKAGALTPERMHAMPDAELASLIRPAGYFNLKAKRLKAFTARLFEAHGGSLSRMFRLPTPELRTELLGIYGIGPETADSIILYGARRAEFVVDAYTARMLVRHGMVAEGAGYEEVKRVFTDSLAPDERTFNEYHALIVNVGKNFCRPKNPLCKECPLGEFL